MLNDVSRSSTSVGIATFTIEPSMVASMVLAATATRINHLLLCSI
jgi:hypothetical protein